MPFHPPSSFKQWMKSGKMECFLLLKVWRAHISTWKFSFPADFVLHFQLKFLICSWFFFISSLLLHFLLPFLCSLYVYCNILAYFTQKRNSQFSRSRFSKPWSQICSEMVFFGESFAPFRWFLFILWGRCSTAQLYLQIPMIFNTIRSQVVARRLAERARQRHTRYNDN